MLIDKTPAPGNELVSLIIPCFNGEKYLDDCLASLYAQSYPVIEVIITDDGSTDSTPAILQKWQGPFQQKGLRFQIIRQTNKGQVEAINAAIPLARGEYLQFLDADDCLMPHALEERVNALRKNPECAFSISNAEFREGNLHGPINRRLFRSPTENQGCFFNDYLIWKDVFAAGLYLIRATCFFATHPDKCLIPCSEGQNHQIMLPLARLYSHCYTGVYDFVVVEHDDSHSRRPRSPHELVEREKRILTMKEAVLRDIDERFLVDSSKEVRMLQIFYSRRICKLGIEHRMRRAWKSAAHELKDFGVYDVLNDNYYSSTILFRVLRKARRLFKNG